MCKQFLQCLYLFVFPGEVRSIHFIHGHDDSHNILPIHYRGGQDVLGLVLREVIHKVTEMFILKGVRDKHGRNMRSQDDKTIQNPYWQGNEDIPSSSPLVEAEPPKPRKRRWPELYPLTAVDKE